MVESVPTHEENPRQLLVVVGHHGRPRSLLGHREKVVDILDGTERLLPELELHGCVELREAGIEMVLEGIGIRQVDGMGLVRVLGDVPEVQTKRFAQAAELHFTLVLQAELESLLGDLLRQWPSYSVARITRLRMTNLVDGLQSCIVFQGLQSGAVAIPQELEPRRYEGPVGPVLGLIAADSTEKNALWGLAGLEIVYIKGDGLVGLFLGLLHLGIGELDEAVYDDFNRRHARVLGDVLVLHEALLRSAAFSEFDTELDKSEHDGFQRGQRRRAESFGREHFCE